MIFHTYQSLTVNRKYLTLFNFAKLYIYIYIRIFNLKEPLINNLKITTYLYYIRIKM